MVQRVVAVGILEDKNARIRGQAVEREVDTFALTASIEELRKRRKELLESVKGNEA